MICKAVRIGGLALALIGFQCNQNTALAQVSKEVAEELMRKSGLWEQLGSVSPQINSAFAAAAAKDGAKLSKGEAARLGKIFASDYAPEHLRSVALATFESQIDSSLVANVLAWYNSPVGRSITRLEEASSAATTDSKSRMREGADLYSRASPDRQLLLKRVVEVSHAAETMVSIVIGTAIGVQQGIISEQPSRVGPSVAEVTAVLEKKRPQMIQAYSGAMLASVSSAYAMASDEDIRRYADFLSSESGVKFTATGVRAVEQALAEAARDLGRDLQGAKGNAGA
jgi:hypothetical protein